MLLLYLVVAFVFFAWWIRGAFWPGAFLAFCSGCVICLVALLAINDHAPIAQTLTDGTMPLVWGALLVSMAPYFIRDMVQRGREERMRESLHGVRFNDPAGD